MKKKVLVMLLAAMLTIPMTTGAVLAEDTGAETTEETSETGTVDPMNTKLVIGSKEYEFPMSVEECKAEGIVFPDFTVPEEGSYKRINVDNGRSAFEVIVESVNGEPWATGFAVEMDKTPQAVIAGVTWNEVTKSELYEKYGDNPAFAEVRQDGSLFAMCPYGRKYDWKIWFNDEYDRDAKVESVVFRSSLPATFGTDFSDKSKQAAEELPDPAEMSFVSYILKDKFYDNASTLQDLLDAGWKLPMKMNPQEDMVEGKHNYCNEYMYDGHELLRVQIANHSGKKMAAKDCVVTTIEAAAEWGTNIVLADGLTLGSTLEEFTATMGEGEEQEANEAGDAVYIFNVLNGTQYRVVFRDGAAIGIRLVIR